VSAMALIGPTPSTFRLASRALAEAGGASRLFIDETWNGVRQPRAVSTTVDRPGDQGGH
jgi:hypothetical protein